MSSRGIYRHMTKKTGAERVARHRQAEIRSQISEAARKKVPHVTEHFRHALEIAAQVFDVHTDISESAETGLSHEQEMEQIQLDRQRKCLSKRIPTLAQLDITQEGYRSISSGNSMMAIRTAIESLQQRNDIPEINLNQEQAEALCSIYLTKVLSHSDFMIRIKRLSTLERILKGGFRNGIEISEEQGGGDREIGGYKTQKKVVCGVIWD